MIFDLESKIALAEENVRSLKEQIARSVADMREKMKKLQDPCHVLEGDKLNPCCLGLDVHIDGSEFSKFDYYEGEAAEGRVGEALAVVATASGSDLKAVRLGAEHVGGCDYDEGFGGWIWKNDEARVHYVGVQDGEIRWVVWGVDEVGVGVGVTVFEVVGEEEEEEEEEEKKL